MIRNKIMLMPERAPVTDLAIELGQDAPREKCGIVGVYDPEGNAVPSAYFAIKALQHRGQDGVGISYINEHHGIDIMKGLGKVPQALDQSEVASITGPELATAHVRYGTTVAEDPLEALHPLPLTAHGQNYTVSHNGEFDMPRLQQLAVEKSVDPSGTDTELFVKILQEEVETYGHMEPALHKLLPQLEGAFSLSILSKDSVYAVRDRHGVRPLVLGKKMGSIMVASEVCALAAADYTFEREVEPGTYTTINRSGVHDVAWSSPNKKTCMFEYVYLSKPDNIINGASVSDYRFLAGEALAKQETVESDLVVPILGSAKVYARGYEQLSTARYKEALIKQSADRTFIAATQGDREAAVRNKFTVDAQTVADKIITLVDDSLVRGTTTKTVVSMLREAGAKEIHVRIGSAEYVKPCTFGVNVQSEKELLSYGKTNEEMAQVIGADSLQFVSLKDMRKAADQKRTEVCDGCMGGAYPKQRRRPTLAATEK